jgi:hypothetical protein
MLTKLVRRLDARHRDEEGAALLSVIVLSVVIFMTIATIALNLQSGIRQSSAEKASITARIAVDSGSDAGLAAAVFSDCVPEFENTEVGYSYSIYGNDFTPQRPTAVDSFGNHKGCPKTGDLYLIVQSIGSSEHGRSTEVVSVYQWGDGSPEQAFDQAATTRQMPTLISRTEK